MRAMPTFPAAGKTYGGLAQAQQQVAAWSAKVVGFQYQLALLDEMAAAGDASDDAAPRA